jgi:hypothetical protein
MKRRAFGESPIIACFYKRGERSQGRVHFGAAAEKWIGAKRRPLTSEGLPPLMSSLQTGLSRSTSGVGTSRFCKVVCEDV